MKCKVIGSSYKVKKSIYHNIFLVVNYKTKINVITIILTVYEITENKLKLLIN